MFLDNMVHSSENREQVNEVEVHWTEKELHSVEERQNNCLHDRETGVKMTMQEPDIVKWDEFK